MENSFIDSFKKIIREALSEVLDEREKNKISREDFEKLQRNYKKLNDDYMLIKSRTEELEKFKEKNLFYKNKYSSLEKIYNNYISLDENIKNHFEGLINKENTLTFLVSGSSGKNLSLIFETISIHCSTYNSETLDVLRSMFDFFFEFFNTIENNKYHRNGTQKGDYFDESVHSRISGGIRGEISEVLIDGYYSESETKKSMVRVVN